MFRKLFILFGLLFVCSLSAQAQDFDRWEVFGGYSFEHFSPPGINLSGIEVSAQHKFRSWIGGVADYDSTFGAGGNSTLNIMVGPQISFPARISPYAQVLGGVGHIKTSYGSDTSFATAFGGGVDMRLIPALSWRVFQADAVVTDLFSHVQHSIRISTGIVVHF